MKSQSYMTRAMRAHDPRFSKILGKLGYQRTDMVAAETNSQYPEPQALAKPPKTRPAAKQRRKPAKAKVSK